MVLTFLTPFLTCFDPFHHVKFAGGLEPALRHFISYRFPAETIRSFPTIFTDSGLTEIELKYTH